MRAFQFQSGQSLALTEIPTPQIDVGEVLCDVVVAGICGTDLKIARGEHRLYPAGTERVPGHELVGRVRENRSGDPALDPGTLVVVAPNMACGSCAACSVGRLNLCLNYESIGLTVDGAFAEAVRIPRRAVEQGNLIPVPAGLSPEVAVLMEPLAAVLHGLRALDLAAGDDVLVFGAGPIGLLAVVLSRQLGAGRIIVSQTSPSRRALALRFGADVAVDPRAEDLLSRVRDVTGGRGAGAVVVATPAVEAYGQALEAAAIGGRINYFAGLPSSRRMVSIDANLVHYRELRITGTTANSTQDCLDALDILAAHAEDYRSFVTHRFPLDAVAEAFEVSAGGTALKVVLTS